jgi:hypothetical protein
VKRVKITYLEVIVTLILVIAFLDSWHMQWLGLSHHH